MTFFYRKAAQLDAQIDEELFRYPGPRPRTRETALVMIADGCEATVRAAADRSPARVRAIVDDIIKERIDEGQFDDCDISLRDLRIVADAYTSTLTAVYPPARRVPRADRAGARPPRRGPSGRREEPDGDGAARPRPPSPPRPRRRPSPAGPPRRPRVRIAAPGCGRHRRRRRRRDHAPRPTTSRRPSGRVRRCLRTASGRAS